jgi:serine phosphatase RsbU (regulator of sigma subunit)
MMSLRTRLIVAFLLLSVLPLSAVTLYSYSTSVRAFQRAVEREAAQSAGDISRRMALVTDDVGRRVDRLFEMSAAPQANGTDQTDPEMVRARLAPMLGDAAALVDQVEFQPMPQPAPGPVSPIPPPARRAPSRVVVVPRVPRPDDAAGPPVPPPPPGAPMVVDVQALLAQTRERIRQSGVLPAEAAAQIEESIGRSVATSLATAGAKAAAAAIARQSAHPELPPPPGATITRHGHEVAIPVQRNGRMVGHARARLNMDRTLGAILTLARSDQGEIPFAIDAGGRLYTPDPSKRATLESLHVEQVASTDQPSRVGEWVVVTRRDDSGLTFGIARPLGESLREIRRTSVRNLSLGLLVVGLAIVGIVPISHRMTDRLRGLTAGVRQLAAGDFRARVPAGSPDEFGALATAFNQMAQDLERHQALAVDQERLRRELELSRQIQMDMLPRHALRFGAAEIKGISIPAREVGGDFFNYFELPGNQLGLLVGDVSGKGVSAALLMANVQATLRARLPLQADLADLTDQLDRELDETTPGGVFVTLFMGVVEESGRSLRYVNAGHNPQYVLRAEGGVESMPATGLPIAMFGGHGYREVRVALAPGDLLFFYTDGLVETQNAQGDMFGAERLEAILVEEHAHGIDAVFARIERDVNAFRGATEPLDDATMMAMMV